MSFDRTIKLIYNLSFNNVFIAKWISNKFQNGFFKLQECNSCLCYKNCKSRFGLSWSLTYRYRKYLVTVLPCLILYCVGFNHKQPAYNVHTETYPAWTENSLFQTRSNKNLQLCT